MSINKRIDDLESKLQLPEINYPVHQYTITKGHESGDERVECPTCAAMSDKEYAAYCEWRTRVGSKGITHVVIVLSDTHELEEGKLQK